MKNLILLFVMTLIFAVTGNSQKIYTLTNSGDTITNTGTVSLTIPISLGYNVATFAVKNTKVSGTVAGTTHIEQSMDNTNWETVTGTDTLTNTNVTTNYKTWTFEPKYPYYRIKSTGSGTMAARSYGYLHLKKF